eukprot:1194687-Prorocentrum_minimum.AAC.3
MGKKGGGKKGGKGKKKKGVEKPDYMTDEQWLLYNNFENLMQNLRVQLFDEYEQACRRDIRSNVRLRSYKMLERLSRNCVFNTINTTISRALAAMWFWQFHLLTLHMLTIAMVCLAQHAASSKAMRVKIVEMGIVPQAVAAFRVREVVPSLDAVQVNE